MEYRTDLQPISPEEEKKELDKPAIERYTSPQSDVKSFRYEPLCIGCRENSRVVFMSACEGCRERSRLLALSKGLT